MTRPLLALVAALGFCACEDGDFDDYNLLTELRVLAIQADPPRVEVGSTSTLQALVYQAPGDANPLTYQWSLCPFRTPSADGGECAIDEATLAEFLGLDPTAVSFDLGTDPTVTLPYFLDPDTLRTACSTEAGVDVAPTDAFLLNCFGGVPISIGLTVSNGEETISAIKTVRMALGDEPDVNTNPVLGGVAFAEEPESGEDALEENAVPLEIGSPMPLVASTDYRFFVDVDLASSDTFTPESNELEPEPSPRLESLFLTWFISEGETSNQRTTFIDDDPNIATIRENVWELPVPAELTADIGTLILVLRDERGGVTWTQRSVDLVQP